MKNKIIKIILGSSFLSIVIVMMTIICVLMIFDFFTPINSNASDIKSTIDSNFKYADMYLEVSNNNIKNGYVSLARLVYFYEENSNLSFDKLYKINQDTDSKIMKTFDEVCMDKDLTNLNVCQKEDISIFGIPNQKFNFPLKTIDYTVSSFFNEERIVFGTSNIHNGWDFVVPPQTKVYSICNGVVSNAIHTQNSNVPYEISHNRTGNYITIECNDYDEKYYVTFHHLYPNSFKVKVGDSVTHWTEIASAGTTGYADGNHLHYGLTDENGNLLDGMLFVDLNY